MSAVADEITESETRERPIIFRGEMVRAILDGRKTQTRRVVKITHKTPGLAACLEPPEWAEPRPKVAAELCPYGQPGDTLYVKETWAAGWADSPTEVMCRPSEMDPTTTAVYYRAASQPQGTFKWRYARFMPRWASRITLEITDIRVERVQDISEDAAAAEGFYFERGDGITAGHLSETEAATVKDSTPRRWFANLWNSINEKRGYGWDVNPHVWVIEFRKL